MHGLHIHQSEHNTWTQVKKIEQEAALGMVSR